MPKEYIIAGGKTGSSRLKKLVEATWPITKYNLLKSGLKTGMSVLDVGCGNGLITRNIKQLLGDESEVSGLDFDAKIIEIAKSFDKESKINFFQFDISKNKLDIVKKYDCIFVKLLLTHISNPNEVIANLKENLNPGGILYLEDIDFSGYFSYPKNEAFDKYVDLYTQLAYKTQGNPFIGRELYQMMLNGQFKNVEVNCSNSAYAKGAGKEIAFLTMKAIRDSLLEYNCISLQEVEQIIFDLKEFTEQEESIISNPRFFHCFGNQ